MGVLKSLNASSLIYLKPVHIFGRDPNVADHILNNDSCSRMHCVIRWESGRWILTDESKNGCFINGNRIERNHSVRLNKGDLFFVGSDREVQWVMASDAPPKPVIISPDKTNYIELQALNILPDENQPECQILKKEQEWFYEKAHDFQAISEGSQVLIENKPWLFHPNQLLDETEFREPADEKIPELTFNVSRNEEHIQLIFEFSGTTFDLGHKTHHYLLLEMARHLLADPTADKKEQGWMSNDVLLHDLGIDINHLNIQIYRTRKAISKCSHHWGQNLVERRRGEIRLHPCGVTINKEGVRLSTAILT